MLVFLVGQEKATWNQINTVNAYFMTRCSYLFTSLDHADSILPPFIEFIIFSQLCASLMHPTLLKKTTTTTKTLPHWILGWFHISFEVLKISMTFLNFSRTLQVWISVSGSYLTQEVAYKKFKVEVHIVEQWVDIEMFKPPVTILT